jgi:23S rRNA C2498 (ribose-2'-O)-methylase RlmM
MGISRQESAADTVRRAGLRFGAVKGQIIARDCAQRYLNHEENSIWTVETILAAQPGGNGTYISIRQRLFTGVVESGSVR